MRFFSILAGALIGLISASAEAKTVRYEFDVVSSVIDYTYLERVFQTPGLPETTEYETLVATFHPLRDIIGQTGLISLHIEYDPSFGSDISCISGFLCPALNTGSHWASPSANGFSAPGDPYYWDLSGDILRFDDDGGISGLGNLGNTQYAWWSPRATFTVANLSITEVPAAPAPVPLPATAWFLGLSLFTLGMKARRRAG